LEATATDPDTRALPRPVGLSESRGGLGGTSKLGFRKERGVLSSIAASLHLLTGLGYLGGLFLLPAWDVSQSWRRDHAVSLFSAILAMVGFAAGIHHLHLAQHLHSNRDPVGFGDFTTILFAVPPALMWTYLRVELLRRGAGERHIPDDPWWIRGTATTYVLAAGAATGYCGARALDAAKDPGGFWDIASWYEWAPQFLAAVSFYIVGAALWRQARLDAQHRNYWSLSGLVLAGVFPTTATSHLIHGSGIMRGFYTADAHMTAISALTAIVAAVFCAAVLRYSHEATVERRRRHHRRPH
jgi:hypothetical protein